MHRLPCIQQGGSGLLEQCPTRSAPFLVLQRKRHMQTEDVFRRTKIRIAQAVCLLPAPRHANTMQLDNGNEILQLIA